MNAAESTAVLLVEDSAVDAKMVQGLLEHASSGRFSVVHATSLAEAARILASDPTDVVILDLHLPDSQGLETLRRLLQTASRIPTVVLTGSDESVGIQAMREGAQDYIPKGQLQAPLLVRAIRYAMERHRSSQALHESNSSLSWVISSAADAIITKDLNGVVTSWNPAAERLFGYAAAEILGKSVTVLFPRNLIDEEREILARIAKGERVDHFESIRLRKDGKSVRVSVTISPIRNSEGRITGASKIARDITAQKEGEEALRRSETRLQRFIEEAPISVAMFDTEMRYLAVSRRWVEVYGRGRQDLNGLRHYDVNPDLPDRWKELHRRALAGENLRNDRDAWNLGSGEQRWLKWAINPWHQSSGEIGGIMILADEITEQVRAEEGLRFHEELLREMGHLAKVGGWQFNVATGEGYWTEEVTRIHELDSMTQISKGKGLEFYQGDSRARIEEALDRAVCQATPYDLELQLVTAKGNLRWIRTIGHPVLEDGKVIKIRGSIQDVTEHRLREEQLREQASLLDQAFDAVLVWERNGPITAWNRGAERIYGFSKNQALGRMNHDLLQTTAPNGFEEVLKTLDAKGNWQGELHHTQREGKRIVVESRMVQLTKDGRSVVLETNRDMSEKRLLEEQLRQSQKMEAIGRLAGGVAHDFNNLLGVILGCSELLLDCLDLTQVRRRAEEIQKAGARAANLTRQLLAFSRKQVIEPRILDLSSKVAEMTEMLQRLVGEDVQIRTYLPSELGNIRVDPSQIEQIVLNLVVNARDAMPNGGTIRIETQRADLEESYVATHSSVQPGPHVMLAVSDSGIGMNQTTLAHIFEPFFTTKPTGTGLGLAMVYGAVKQSGGNIWVYSEEGNGTTFKIYFPRLEWSAAQIAPTQPTREAARGSGTILVVEDSDSLRELTSEFLTKAGYNVVEARDGEEALRIARGHGDIDLLLTDVVMPGMNGRELADEIRRIHAETLVLFMSGYTANAISDRGVLGEDFCMLTKPFTRAALTSKISEILNSRKLAKSSVTEVHGASEQGF